VFVVIIGGIKSIGSVAEKVIPFMAGAYVIIAVLALILNASEIPATFGLIFYGAFNPQAAVGGFAGAAIIIALRAGVARGLFSNEAGQGSTAIAHAVAQTNDPESQGRMAMLGTFIDTIVICTMTALVILSVRGEFAAGAETVAYAWQSDRVGFEMTSAAFATAFPMPVAGIPIGTLVTSIVLILFVFTTLLTWSYYGERAITFLYDRIPGSTRGGEKILHITWRVLWCVVIFLAAALPSEVVWRMGDISNAAMALPNLLALLLLSGVVFKLAKGFKDAGPTHHVDTPEEPEEY
jgi:AGCS family alanine or glycine:cation symporter